MKKILALIAADLATVNPMNFFAKPVYHAGTYSRRTRIAGKHNPAGSKLARKAFEGVIGVRHGVSYRLNTGR